MGNAAQRQASLPDHLAIETQGCGDRHQRERVGGAVANFQITVMFFEHRGRQLDGNHQFIDCQLIVSLRGVLGETMERRKRYLALSARPLHMHHGFERCQCHAHIRGMGRDTGITGTKNRVDTVRACTRRASAAGFTLVAGRAGVVEVVATGTLQQVATGAGHVPQLR